MTMPGLRIVDTVAISARDIDRLTKQMVEIHAIDEAYVLDVRAAYCRRKLRENPWWPGNANHITRASILTSRLELAFRAYDWEVACQARWDAAVRQAQVKAEIDPDRWVKAEIERRRSVAASDDHVREMMRSGDIRPGHIEAV